MGDLETSQNFISKQYYGVTTHIKETSDSVRKLEIKVSKMEIEKSKVSQEKESLKEDIIDLKCRSMRDNLIFFGIPEPSGITVRGSDSTSSYTNNPSGSNGIGENCEQKVFDFCENILKIVNPKSCIDIDRAHRIGGRVTDKVRPIVVKFKDTKSKMKVKYSLKDVELRPTAYGVSEQFPAEIQERRKSLYPIMKEARDKGKRTVLVRDKLYINNKLYSPSVRDQSY